jgi:hypothetical protein
MARRETGSILVNAPRERVFEALQERLAKTGSDVRSIRAERIESDRRTFVLQDAASGTRIVLGRTAPTLGARRDELRDQVAQELLALQKLVE